MLNPVDAALKLEKSQHETLNDIKDIKAGLSSLKPPEPWQAHFSEKYGRVYFYNPITKESIWEFPIDTSNLSMKETSGGPAPSSQSVVSTGNKDERIEDSLMQRGLTYLKKREELKKQHELAIQAEMTGKPQLSKYALTRATSREMSETIAERTATELRNKREKEEALRRERDEMEQRELRSNPVITKKSQNLHRSVDDMLSWDEKRKAKIEAKQLELEQQEEQLNTAAPFMPTRAVNEKLLRNRRNKSSEGVPIEERLQEYEEIRRWKQQQAAEKADREARLAAKPTIVTRYAQVSNRNVAGPSRRQGGARREEQNGEEEPDEDDWSDEEEYNRYRENMRRLEELERSEAEGVHASRHEGNEEMDAGTRLYRQAEVAHRERAVQQQYREAIRSNYDADGAPLFQPRINKTSNKIADRDRLRSHVPVEELLFMKGQEREERARRRQEKIENEVKAQSNISKINPTSEKILREKEMVTGSSTSRIDRLTKPIGTVKQSVLEGIEQPTFAPKISKKSAQLATQGYYHSYGSGNRNVRQPSAERDRDRSYMSDGGHAHDDLNEPLDYSDGHEQSRDPTSVYNRASSWAERRDKRLNRERQAREQELLKDCTFRPQIYDAPNQDGRVSRGRSSSRTRSLSRERRPISRDRSYSRDRSVSSNSEYYNDGNSDSEFRRGADVSSRHNDWARKRDLKLALERKRREEDAMRNCSFAPNLNHKSNGMKSHGRPSGAERLEKKIENPSRGRGPGIAIPAVYLKQHESDAVRFSYSYESSSVADVEPLETSIVDEFGDPIGKRLNFDELVADRHDFQTYESTPVDLRNKLQSDYSYSEGGIEDYDRHSAYEQPSNFVVSDFSKRQQAAPVGSYAVCNEDPLDEMNDYGVEFELDESGDIINAGSGLL